MPGCRPSNSNASFDEAKNRSAALGLSCAIRCPISRRSSQTGDLTISFIRAGCLRVASASPLELAHFPWRDFDLARACPFPDRSQSQEPFLHTVGARLAYRLARSRSPHPRWLGDQLIQALLKQWDIHCAHNCEATRRLVRCKPVFRARAPFIAVAR